ncbi:GGDEF domain-containing protein [Paracoccus thiocyanatus]|uniref:GGDEF domain-containing protein n=1 Tax=Paracoccus thiocyanatus TaxID=34006 RepID=UPI00122CB464|nr:GGDEF domain-containing protein [Paracoccus thiocyanatus]
MKDTVVDLPRLAQLVPMHLLVDRTGTILSRGRTLSKVLAGASRLEEAFVPANGIGLGSGPVAGDLFSLLGGGKRIFLQMRHHPDVALRGHGVRLSPDIALLDLGFGIGLSAAVQTFGLNDSDFPPSDLAMEFLFLHEANRAALQELSRVNSRLEEARENAQILSITDPLTGLLNRRGFEIVFTRAFDQRHRKPFALVHLDLDRFKDINDTFGHATGDRVLTEIASILATEVRLDDRACRVGGDEFLMLIFAARPEADAMAIGKRILDRAGSVGISAGFGAVSASMGVAVCDGTGVSRPHQLFEMADAALYRAKLSGRGRVVQWSDTMR